MTDLLSVLPHFPIGQYANLIPALERHHLSTSDLLTLDVADIGKRTHLPLLDIRRLCNAILDALHRDLGVAPDVQKPEPRQIKYVRDEQGVPAARSVGYRLRNTHASLSAQWQTISTLDPTLDRALGGGVPAGYVTEVTGESGVGKTQFLLSLLLAVQLPPPHGLGRPALYVSTEAALSTRRLAQILAGNPVLKAAAAAAAASGTASAPSLDNIISTATPDLESQDHILSFQVPVEVERRNVGLLVIDSVAANYRAEFERRGAGGSGGANMAARSADLVRLGMLLRGLARRHNLAVVVANQVADRFGANRSPAPPASLARWPTTQESPLASRSRANPPAAPLPPSTEPPSSFSAAAMMDAVPPPRSSSSSSAFAGTPNAHASDELLLLDHQQRWFTGWGDDADADGTALKTPSLGLVWSIQVAARIALVKRAAYLDGPQRGDNDGGGEDGSMPAPRSWRRWMKVVFAPHVAASGPGVEGATEFEITAGGLKGVADSEGG